MTMAQYHIVLATGGIGGHVMPALALAQELIGRGHSVDFVTDERGARYLPAHARYSVEIIRAGTFARGSFLNRILFPFKIGLGILAGIRRLRRDRPAAVIGFGGYPALPTLIAARLLGISTCLHEQNAVLGRVNRLLVRWTKVLAVSHDMTKRVPASVGDRVVLTGNPVRGEIAGLAEAVYPVFDEYTPINLLVLGGSQGATVLSEIVPDGLALLPPPVRQRFYVGHQARANDIELARRKYRRAGIKAIVSPFFEDMCGWLSKSHLIIARAGASTISEISAAARPSILIPFPAAMDDHQAANTRDLADAGAARVITEVDFTPTRLAKEVHQLLARPEKLKKMSDAARTVSRPDAARRLADLVEGLARAGTLAAHNDFDIPDKAPPMKREAVI